LIGSKEQQKQAEKSTLSPITIELLPYFEQAEAARRWQELEQRVKNTDLTNSWVWTRIWLEHHHDSMQPVFAFGRRDNQVVGATLVVTDSYTRKSLPMLPIARVYIGTGEYTKYNRLLVAPEDQGSFALALIQAVQREFRWSELHFDGFAPEHGEALLRAGKDSDLLFRVQEDKSPAFDFQLAIDDGHQDIISALGKNTRYNLRRSSRLFNEKYGQQSREWAETPEQAKDILKELIELNKKRWARLNQAGSFDQPSIISYHLALIDELKLWPQGSVIVFRVKAGETTLGCIFHFVENEQLLFSKSGINQFEDAKLKPGLLTHLACMEECWRRSFAQKQLGKPGIARYDFLSGEGSGQYKDSLSNREGYLLSATAERGILLWLMGGARRVKNTLKK
jgi:CelD/BcsL family acetyltransferase involved in cellulose biosynthesis